MKEKELLIENIEKIHITTLGVGRIKRNLNLDTDDVVKYCVNVITDENSVVNKNGKNYYVKLKNTEITVNSSSFTIITAHLKKE
ncbi:MAG: conjugal transfer protein [Methanosphaera sp. rholeuAM6]|nr:MAG: conjugal transfer protein [Methanosphaera sp. rholeuAM6]